MDDKSLVIGQPGIQAVQHVWVSDQVLAGEIEERVCVIFMSGAEND